MKPSERFDMNLCLPFSLAGQGLSGLMVKRG